MRFARGLLIFSYGLFTIAAQTLLFRDFLTSFEGNDISVGIFFGSWFLWIGLGAILVYRGTSFAEKLLKNIEFLFLCYLPAFILQLILIIQARNLAGVQAHALLSIRAILLLSILVNAPVSIITGMFFPLACRWVQKETDSAISNVYVVEAGGSFVGGLGATILLGLGVSSAKIFFILASVLSISVFAVQLAKVKTQTQNIPGLRFRYFTCAVSFLIPLSFGVCLIAGVDKALMNYVRVVKWTKLLPEDSLIGSFQTAQAEYLYGIYQGQWVAVREGSVCEVLPDKASAGQVAAISLCQNPGAENILVVGSGLGVCYEFLRLPQIKHITWAHSDSEYAKKVDSFIPPQFKTADQRLRRLDGDIRVLLSGEKWFDVAHHPELVEGQNYDIVIVNLPEATSSVLNRYYTLEFFQQVKDSLRPDGILAIRVAGGENIMGTELVNLGASTKLTLEKVFSRLVITPGEYTWFIASDSGKLTGDPAVLRDRFAAIKDAAEIFAPPALLSVYLPDRAAKALEDYARADLPESMLVNRDSRPLTHLYSLLLAAKQSGAPVARLVKHLALAGPAVFVVPILVLIVLRAIYVLRTEPQGNKTSFDSSFLVFSTGWIGIGVVIVLMYLYQTLFGSLYLHIGVISSLFMVGLTVGAAIIRHLLARTLEEKRRVRVAETLLLMVTSVHTVILAAVAFRPIGQWSRDLAGLGGVLEPMHLIFAGVFILCGLCSGCYFPIAARQLAVVGFEAGQAGSKLETADHLGASLGGVVTGLVLVPVFGAKVTLLLFIALILANLPLAGLKIYRPESIGSLKDTTFRLRKLGFILLGVGLSIVISSNLLAQAGARLRPSLPQSAAQGLAGVLNIERVSAVLHDDARKVNYFTVSDEAGNLNGYVFSSEDLSPEVRGYGGKINLAIYVDTAGKLINFHIIRSNETPSYLELLDKWCGLLAGRGLFGPKPFADVDAVTGATISSKAVLSALQTSGQRFAVQILGQSLQPQMQQARWTNYLPDTRGLYLIGAFVLALIVTYRGGFWTRLGVLIFNLVVGGIILNAQYSTEQIVTLLSAQTPALSLAGAFLLVIGVPIFAIIFGNMYCGYVCPFGAAQELLGFILPARFRQPISIDKMQKARFVKYVILFVFVIIFFFSRNRATLGTDPLISIFNFRFTISDFQSAIGSWQTSMWLVVAVALFGAVLYPRFWCRYLCPVGAFLSLFNNVVILKRYVPAKWFGRCGFGLTAKDRMDCIYCDKCRYEAKAILKQEALEGAAYRPVRPLSRLVGAEPSARRGEGRCRSRAARYFVICVLAAAILVSVISINKFFEVAPIGIDYSTTVVSSAGQPRDVDLQRVRTLIEQKRLSDREAEFYKKVD
jgi:spermidine synthase